MAKNKEAKNSSIARALQEIDIIFSLTVKRLEKLHQKKMKLIKYYQEADREDEIERIRKSLKNI
jgi:hypothetical protein